MRLIRLSLCYLLFTGMLFIMQNLSVCVYCGSRVGNDPQYKADADALGQALAKAKMRLVYGAGDIGLMGTVARATQGAGGDVMGIIPTHLMKREVGRVELTQFIVTENMHERKKVMFMNSDAVVVLPGGAGSLDEFFEVLTWAQIGLHSKPIFVLNTNGYWSPLMSLIDHTIANGFADENLKSLFVVKDSVPDLMAALSAL